MDNRRIYYARVSSKDQNLARQIELFKSMGAKDYPFIIFRLMRWVSRISAPVAESISVHP